MVAERIRSVDTSALERVLALVNGGDLISFAGGIPNGETFPREELREILSKVVEMDEALQYGSTAGVPELREEIARYMGTWGARVSREEVIVTHGSQQGIDMISRALIEPGDILVVEKPTYFVALNTFQIYNPLFEQVPLDDEGLRTEELEELLGKLKAEGKGVRLLYTVPTFQNPAGVTMSEERRKALAELAEEHDFLILEDNPYGELRYEGKRVKAVKAFAPERTIYLGSFSKTFVPGFRIAWLVAPEELIRPLSIAKQTTDICTNTFGQYATLFFLREHFERHVERLRRYYGPKRKAMLDALEEHMPETVEWTRPEGGMFVWLRTGRDTDELLKEAVGRGVAYVPGSAFYAKDPERNAMRLNFTFESVERIEQGVKILAELV